MRKLVSCNLAMALFGLILSLVPTGCSDDAGGNEKDVMAKTDGGRGVTAPDSPRTPEDYYKKHQRGRR